MHYKVDFILKMMYGKGLEVLVPLEMNQLTTKKQSLITKDESSIHLRNYGSGH